MKILITGALGHIGSRLIRQLPINNEKAEIILFDNLSTQRYCSLFNLPKGIKYTFIEGDILTYDLNSLFRDIDYVIHLAAITNAAGSFDMQEEVEKVNLSGTKRVAQACARSGSSLMYLSTTSVYGTQSDIVDENCLREELLPQSPYAESKLRSEEYIQAIGESQELNYSICRFGTIYGTSIGMRFHTAINKFCWQAVMGQPITVWRTALNQKRPYLDLDDAVQAIQFFIQNNHFDNEVYNVLSMNATVNDICNNIKAFVPTLSIEMVDSKIMNQLSYNVSNEKISNLGFNFSGNMERGIRKTIELLSGFQGENGFVKV